jgi:quercetin 2,3-dioxygenase
MPAVTVDDVGTLPRIEVAAPAGAPLRARPVRRVTTAPRGFEGEGFPVRRAFAGVDMADLDPFIHLDQIGEIEYAPGEPKGTAWHPHRGFETVTYVMDGLLRHEDSTGGGGLISDGDTQWMTAGAGILHIETPPEHFVASGGQFHGLQLWVNLPRSEKWAEPRYQDLAGEAVRLLASPDGGAIVRLIAGELGGHRGPGATRTPMTMVHATLAPGAELVVPWPREHNALVYVLGGEGAVGDDGRPVETGQLALLGPGDTIVTRAAARQGGPARQLDLLVLGGRPIREPVAWAGPFVMNTRAELVQAFEDFQAGRLGTVPAVHATPTDEVALETDASLD